MSISYSMTDKAVAIELGRRIELARLEKNRSHQYMAEELGVTRQTYAKAEKGEMRFEIFVGILRLLGRLDSLDALFPDMPFSPVEQLKLQKQRRLRAGRSRGAEVKASKESKSDLDEGDDRQW